MRRIALVLGLVTVLSAQAQIHTTKQKYPSAPEPRAPAGYSPKQMDCKAITQKDPHMRSFCEAIDYDFGVGYSARAFGTPRPSREVIPLPAHGTPKAAEYGVACMGQLAMRRLANGWEQLRDIEGNYLRCRDS